MQTAAIASLAHARAYLLAGAAVFTLVSKNTGARRTFRVRKAEQTGQYAKPGYFVDVLSGPENSSDYSYIGFLFEGKRAHAPGASGPELRLKLKVAGIAGASFSWLISILNGASLGGAEGAEFERTFAAQAEFWHSGSCARCGRLLTDPESIARGLGPTCAERS